MSRSDQIAKQASTSNSPNTQAVPDHDWRQREAEKTRLTDDQKKNNHITSEQNRRNFLRSQFDRLSKVVPGTEGKARSEALVLEKTVDHGRTKLAEGRAMIEEIERRGGHVDQEVKAKYYHKEELDGYGEVDDGANQNMGYDQHGGGYGVGPSPYQSYGQQGGYDPGPGPYG